MKIKIKDINGNWVWYDTETKLTTSAEVLLGTIRNNAVKSVGADTSTKKGRVMAAHNQTQSYNRRLHKVHNYADQTTRLKLKQLTVSVDKLGEPIINQTDYTPNVEAPMIPYTPLEEMFIGTKALDLPFKIGTRAATYGLAKYGSLAGLNAALSWARNKIMNGVVTKNLNKPLLNFEIAKEVPLQKGYMYHSISNAPINMSEKYKILDGKMFLLNKFPGEINIKNNKWVSENLSKSGLDRIWWDLEGHNTGNHVFATKASGFKLDDPNSGAIRGGGFYEDSYRTTLPMDKEKVVHFLWEPMLNTYIPKSPYNQLTTNKMSIQELLTPLEESPKTLLDQPKTSLAFFERQPAKISLAERMGIPKVERNLPFKEKQLTEHVQGDEAVKMFKEYGGESIPEGSINGELLRKYVAEARERYGLIGNNNITDEEIALALYKHSKELGGNTAAINALGEPLLLFRGDTQRYTQLKKRISPEELAKKSGTMDNSLGNLFLGEFPYSYRGVDRYIGTWRNFNGSPKLVGSGTGSKVVWDGKIASEIEGYPYLGPLAGGGYKLYSQPHRYGNIDVYKLPASMMESEVNDLNAFIVRTPQMRNASSEISVLNDDWMLQGAKDSHFMSKNYKYNPKTYSMENVKTGESLGKVTIESAPASRIAMGDHYKELLKEAKQKQEGLLKSEANSPLRDEHSLYSYFVLPNFNIQGAKHLLPYDLRIPRNWKDKNIYRGLIPLTTGYTLYNSFNQPQLQLEK